MNKKSVSLLLLAAIFVLLLFSLQSCTDMGYQPSGDYISGWAIIGDTNLLTGGYYAISVFANRQNPFDTLPLRSDSLNLVRYTYDYRSYYRISGLPSGSYFLAVTWIEYPLQSYNRVPVLGTWRCDTIANCTNHELIPFPNFTGANYNIIAWADTSKKLN